MKHKHLLIAVALVAAVLGASIHADAQTPTTPLTTDEATAGSP